MENFEIRERFNIAKDSFINKIKKNKKCLAAFLIGSVSHDLIWEWSDLQILLIFDDGYKWSCNNLIEHDVPIVINVRTKTNFIDYLSSANVSDYYFCALSKSTPLFVKDTVIQECFEDMFYIGDRDREVEMILSFSNAVYCMNKAEKNFYIKRNTENTTYFLFRAADAIAYLEVAKHRIIPEREIIAQAKKLNPELFQKIYECMIKKSVTDSMLAEIINMNLRYLEENTAEVYRPVLEHLKKHGNLDKFSMPTRPDSFGIDLLWLYRMGILDRVIEPSKIASQNEEFSTYKYVLSERYKRQLERGEEYNG